MRIDWASMLTILLAIVLASLIDHLVIMPRLGAERLAREEPTPNPTPHSETVASYVARKYPNAN